MGGAARDRAERAFSWRAAVAQHEDLYAALGGRVARQRGPLLASGAHGVL